MITIGVWCDGKKMWLGSEGRAGSWRALRTVVRQPAACWTEYQIKQALKQAAWMNEQVSEEKISKLEDILVENSKIEKQEKKEWIKAEQNIQELWDNTKSIKYGNTRRKKKGTAEIPKKIMTDNFPKLMSDTKPQMQKFQGTSRRTNDKTNK